MRSSRSPGAVSVPMIILIIVAGAIVLSLLFYSFWQKLNHKVEVTLRDQFNQQQLMLARKIADNVESYFDYLENELLSYPNVLRNIQPDSPEFQDYMAERIKVLGSMGILAACRYDAAGTPMQVWGLSLEERPFLMRRALPTPYLKWTQDPKNRGHLLLGKTYRWQGVPWEGRLVMPFLTQIYRPGNFPRPLGSLELLIDPTFICGKVTKDVRSGETGYPWIIDQNGILLAHYEPEFVGHDALKVRLARNPKIIYKGLRELQTRLLEGHEGSGEYTSGWHRQKLGEIHKLAAYTPVRFQKGLIRGVTDVMDPAGNLWGVALVAPVAEVSGNVAAVLHQELFLVGMFFLVVLIASGGLIGTALTWNRTLRREVEQKTWELLESQERLVHSERFAAVGEAAAYVSHEIKNPLTVIGGMAGQVERRLPEDDPSREKMQVIKGEVKRLESFLGDLRDFTRPMAPKKQEIDLNRVIHEVEAMMTEAAREKGISLEERLDPVPRMEADPNQIKQVLVNLIKNAMEATGGKGRIFLTSGFKDGQAWFSVQDTGKGMGEEELDKLFHPFFTTKEKGTGLGLAVIHKIITDHHGTITAQSTAGQGSTFTIRLPLKG